MLDDGLQTRTSHEQMQLEGRVADMYAEFGGLTVDDDDPALELDRTAHVKYVQGGLGALPSGFIALDASRTWICFWVAHSLALLDGAWPESPTRAEVIDFLASCQRTETSRGGGFGGGPHQLGHLAPCYAAVAALVTIGGTDALRAVDRPALRRFLLAMARPAASGGGFTMHQDGEVDVRGCYCAMAAAHMLGLDVEPIAQAADMVSFVKRCQTYEGGLGGEPGNEAHGGYTFCGLAALMFVNRADVLDIPRLVYWAVHLQGDVEGGFMGRTNKLVDGCYSFWQGGLFPLLARLGDEHTRQSSVQRIRLSGWLRGRETAGGGGASQSRQDVPQASNGSGGVSTSRGAGACAPGGADSHGAHGDEREADEREAAPSFGAREQAALHVERMKVNLLEAVQQASDAEVRFKHSAARREDVAPLKAEVRELLDEAAEAQEALDRAAQHQEAVENSAAVLCSDYLTASLDSPAVQSASSPSGRSGDADAAPLQLYNAKALQLWILKCCQAPKGGLRDKPGKPPDYYHTCYCLSGLSSGQHASGFVLGPSGNLLARADPLCNVVESRLVEARAFYANEPTLQ